MAFNNNSQKKKQQDIIDINAQYGRKPPEAEDLEALVLGAIMLEQGSEIDVMNILKADSFYNDKHRKIFEVIIELSSNHLPIDIYTVSEQLRAKGLLEEVGGAYYIASLTQNVGSAAHLEFHARIIAQKYIQRELIKAASEIENRAYDLGSDVDDLLNFSEKKIFDLAYGNIKNDTQSMDQVLKDCMKQLDEASKRTDGLSGVPSGFTSLDRITQGWQRSDMIVIAARPSMGKTAFVLSMARNMTVYHKVPVAIFSLEMSAVQLVNRLIVSETELGSEKIRTGKLEDYEWTQLESKIKNLEGAPLYIDDTAGISLFELRAKCRRLKMQHNIEMVIIDYLQLMTGPPEVRGNREQEVSTISRGIKQIAKELNIPIIALSQLSRAVEVRAGDKRPQLSDLRESGAIEQDADIVCFIHRPEKFGIMQDDEGNSTEGLGQIIIAKHRNGALEDVNLKFRAEFARFEEEDNQGLMVYSSMNDDSPNNSNVGGLPDIGGYNPFEQSSSDTSSMPDLGPAPF
ncbi:MAG: replicative DNA helicase [Bacteroidales bacterium]|nr:replicative DNA helicase [Bacteroidales bacterium]